MFDSLVEDCRKAENDCREAITMATTAADKPESQEKYLRIVQDYLVICERAGEAISNELRTMPGNKTASAAAKQHRAELASLKRMTNDLENAVQRGKLLGEEGKSTSSSQRLMDTSERLAQGSRGIDDARRVALETEEIGIDVMTDLRGQRDVILRTRNHMVEISGSLDQSRRTLRTMGRKMAYNKIALLGIIVVLFVALIFIVYVKLRPR